MCAYNGYMKQENIAAYAAGIFDGEGYIGIDKISVSSGKKKAINLGLRVVISQKDGLIMDWLKINFGGNVYKQRNGSQYYIYRWRIHSLKAQQFLKTVLPYLIIKKAQSEFAIKFHDEKNERYEKCKIGKDGRYQPILETENKWRMEMKQKLSDLKRDYKPYTIIS